MQDIYSRLIVGWAMADHMRTGLVTDALRMALARWRPEPGLIWHSDHGRQFVSLTFGQQARAAGIAHSMGSKGDCFDDAVAQSSSRPSRRSSSTAARGPSKAKLRTEVFAYIEISTPSFKPPGNGFRSRRGR